ncbi:hypothetical protein [Streptomyces rubrogriseus]|uniref:hypothetical protein n=1 Tax=Streptomyces rubrogriseus TaxID=194673 RepID=UPI0037D84A2B
MTVPTNPEMPRSEVPVVDTGRRTKRANPIRRRLMLLAGLVVIGLGVVVLVLAFPRLAAPIGTSAGVVAAVVPLLQRLGHGGATGGGSANEP